MARAEKLKQLSFTMPNRVGLLSEVSTAIAGAKVNINAICAYVMEDKAYFMLSTDSNAKAKKALGSLGVEIKEEDVIAVEMPNRVGELQKVAKKIADAGIDINYMYGTAGAGKSSTCVFKTVDDKKALRVINK
ncbi:MAG: ACT domain-containing protein [Nitrospirota bacterium]